MPMKKKRMGQRNALYWAKALWSLWNSTDDEDERRSIRGWSTGLLR